MTELPPGFVLEGAPPEPPPGFILETPPGSVAPPGTEPGGPVPPAVTRPPGSYRVEEPEDPIAPGQSAPSAFGRGVVRGATAEFGDELAGVRAAAPSLPPGLSLSPNPVAQLAPYVAGGARLAYEGLTGTGTEAPQAESAAMQVARREAGIPAPEPTPRPGSATELARRVTEDERNANRLAEMEAPGMTLAGQITGAVAAPVGATALRGVAMGIRMLRGALTAGGMGFAAGAGEGETLPERGEKALTGGVIGGTIGAVLPVGAEAVARTGRAVFQPIARAIARYRDEEGAAARAVAETYERAQARAAGGKDALPRAEFDRLKAEGAPVVNLDMTGTRGQRLAKASANLSEDAKQALQEPLEARFASEGERAGGWLARLVGRKAINIDEIREAKTGANSVAYKRAYTEGAALNARAGLEGAFWTTELRRLSRAPDVREAMLGIGRQEGNRSIIAGFPSPAHNPWVEIDTPAGKRIAFREYETGNKDTPSLEAWDAVQRILRAKYKAALGPNGDVTSEARQIGILRDRLNTELDRIAPRFREARGTAYRGFKAEDAWEAGENYVTGTYSAREAAELAKQIRDFSAADRVLFMHGFASTLIKRVTSMGDNQALTNRIFNSPEARKRVAEAMGEKRAKEIEAYLHVARIANRGKNAVTGGSSTTEQVRDVFMSMGREAQLPIASGLATGAATGDWGWSSILAGTAVAGGRHVKRKMSLERDARIATHIGEMLASNDPDIFRRGIAILASHERMMDRVRNFATPASRAAAPQTTDLGGAQLQGAVRAPAEEEK